MASISSFAPLTLLAIALIAGCATTPTAPPEPPPAAPVEIKPAAQAAPKPPRPKIGQPALPPPAVGPAAILPLLPKSVPDPSGWAGEIQGAMQALGLAPTMQNYCAAIAVIEQESGFQSDPIVPGLPGIVWQEIESRREKYGIPKLVMNAALGKSSPDGRSYRARIDSLKTESELSLLFEQMISELPFGKRLFGNKNPVRTGGPMQVSVEFAESQILQKRYPYSSTGSVRHEVFTRRGGLYFGISDLLDYPAPYQQPIYRFADYNAGRFSSRNAAFQSAVATLTGTPLSLDGDLLGYEQDAGETERAVLTLAPRLRMSEAEIRRDLALEKTAGFAQSRLYQAVFSIARPDAPRALVPKIVLQSPKIHRRLTTEWFASRVEMRYRKCLKRDPQQGNPPAGG